MTALVAAAALLSPALAPGGPLILVVQTQVVEFTDYDPNLDVMRPLAMALEESRRVTTAIWSEGNPLIAALIESGDLRNFKTSPKQDEAFRAARAMRADYVLFCEGTAIGGQVNSSMEFFKGGRSLAKETTTTAIYKDNVLDKESSVLSIANTFVTKLFNGPLAHLPTAGIQNPDPGQPTITVTPGAGLPVDKEPFEKGKKALSEGKVLEAVDYLRDAVDADPTNAEARLLLIESLKRAGKPFLAADEALRGAMIDPNDSTLLVAAADAWLEGGKPEKALELVNEALRDSPNNDTALALLGDLHVGQLEYEKAIDAYSRSLAVKPNPEVYYRRAQVYALIESYANSKADLDKALELGLSQDAEPALKRYRAGAKVLDNAFTSVSTSVRNMLIEAKAGGAPDLPRRAAEVTAKIAGFTDYVAKMPAPAPHAKSHEHRLLALSLLLQSSLGLQKHLQNSDSETREEATLLQIESMREYALGQTVFGNESKN